MTRQSINRRRLLLGSAVLGAAGVAEAAAHHDGMLGGPSQTFHGTMPWQEGSADAPPAVSGTNYIFFNPAEAAFIEAAVERLIPSDATGPGAMEAGVPIFLDRQLAGQFGQGQHFYLGGPWPKGVPEQGYQARYTPAQLYRAAIAAIEAHVGRNYKGSSFAHLAPADQDKVLKGLESGDIQLEGVDGKGFFTAFLLQNTKEGYFSDPLYGGNRNMAAWKMIGFPGAHYDYREWVSRFGQAAPFAQVGITGRPGWTGA